MHNINGGLTALYALNPIQRACVDAMLRRNVSYSILPAPALCHKLAGKFNSLFILDVRPDSAWKHIATNPKQNALGYLKGTKHIALANLRERLSEVPKGKEIVVTDLFGSDAAQAAKLLKENGYDKVSMLLEGIDRWLYADLQEAGCTKDLYVPAADFTILGTGAFSRFYQANKNALLLDVRSSMEFSGSHKDAFRNIGYLDKAINIPADSLGIQVSALEKYRSSPVIVYAFSGGPEAYAAAAELKRQGFGQVYVLAGGLFHIRWTAANMPGMAFLNDWVKGVPPENL